MLSSARMPITVRSHARRDAGALQRRDRDEAGDHAGGAVEIAAMRHRIEMRADDDALRGRVAAGQRHVQIGRGVVLDAQAQPLRGRGHRGMRALFAGAVRDRAYARFVEPVAAQLVEQCRRQFALLRHRRNDIHGGSPAPHHCRYATIPVTSGHNSRYSAA